MKYENDVLTARLAGELDHHLAAEIRAKIDEAMMANLPKKLILELSEIEFMDSSGLGLIMGRYELMRELGGDVTVRDPAPCVDRMLKLTGFDRRVKTEISTARPRR